MHHAHGMRTGHVCRDRRQQARAANTQGHTRAMRICMCRYSTSIGRMGYRRSPAAQKEGGHRTAQGVMGSTTAALPNHAQ